jgi:hypothetical protein
VKKCISRFAGVAFAGLLTMGIASANITPTFITDTAAGGGLFTYSYTLALDAAQTLITNSEFCFAGVQGLAGTPTAPSSWTAADSASACPIAAGAVPGNNIGPSVLYIWHGSSVTGPSTLGTFTFQSTFSTPADRLLAFGATAQLTTNGLASANQGETFGPQGTVPEPSTFLLIGAGLMLAAKISRLKLV